MEINTGSRTSLFSSNGSRTHLPVDKDVAEVVDVETMVETTIVDVESSLLEIVSTVDVMDTWLLIAALARKLDIRTITEEGDSRNPDHAHAVENLDIG